MNHADDDPRCPECGGPIGQTATYCMHCSADLTAERAAADVDGDGAWDGDSGDARNAERHGEGDPTREGASEGFAASVGGDEQLLDPDGLIDNTFTVLVGIGGGIVVGVVGTAVLLALTGSGWALLFGLGTWLGATAYLVRRRTVQAAVAKSGYAVAAVLLLVPVVALSPAFSVDGGPGERGGLFVVLFVFAAVPAGIAATVGWVASQFVPEDGTKSES